MRTTLDLPEDLVNEAMKAAHINTKTKVIITALEEIYDVDRKAAEKEVFDLLNDLLNANLIEEV